MIIVQLLHSYVLLYGSKWQLPPLEKTAAATFFHRVFQKSGAVKRLLDTTESEASLQVLHRIKGWKTDLLHYCQGRTV